jgi:hypothetical protein
MGYEKMQAENKKSAAAPYISMGGYISALKFKYNIHYVLTAVQKA